MKNKDIFAATAVAALSATSAAATPQDIGTANAADNVGSSIEGQPTDNVLNDSRSAVRAMLSAKLNGLVESGDNPSGEFQVVDYFVAWNSYGLVVKSPSPRFASIDSEGRKALMENPKLNQKIALGQATYRDLIETVNEMGLDQRPGSVRMGDDGMALI